MTSVSEIVEPSRPHGRWSRDSWIAFATEQLRAVGPSALTLEALCEAAGRTRGSFYHHFPTVGALLAEIASRWRQTETDEIGAQALATADARSALRVLARRSDRMDHKLEIGVRALARDPAVAAIIRKADLVREAIVASLLSRAYGLPPGEAADVARLFHSLQLAGQLREPDNVSGFVAAPARRLTEMLEARARS